MASQERLADKEARQHDTPNVLAWILSALRMRGSDGATAAAAAGGGGGGLLAKDHREGCPGRCHPSPQRGGGGGGGGGVEVRLGHLAQEKVAVCCDEELETSFTYVDENVNLRLASPDAVRKSGHKAACNGEGNGGTVAATAAAAESLPELSMEDLSFGDSFETSLDQGFVCAVTFLVTGISLVIISYVVPRGVAVDRESVSAREMERLEREGARVGAHLDRCVIAGLCLLTLGGVVLSVLLMISMWKGEVYRRRALAYTKRSTKLYGSINLVTRASPPGQANAGHAELDAEETVT